EPQLWIWTGDNVYGDTLDMSVLATKYREQSANPGYQQLQARVPVTGTWDDHDYGTNDGDASYPMKAESQQLLLDFLGVPANDPRRTREGVYSSYVLGKVPRQVKVILLDVRYHREPPGPEADVLGEEQWRWLENELNGSTAQLTLIVSGTQMLPADHEWERWAAYPAARQRLLDLITESGKPGVVLISGDRHFAELTRFKPKGFYPLYEVTSSGLTHFWEEMPDEVNRARIQRFYKGLNFGLIEVLWEARPGPLLRLEVRDERNHPQIRIEFPLADLAVADW
ncbi:MAG: alkaline phosphatase family protein, partial [Gammaproteobacteria bacterium]|nr:alkaline phosphatase family protein [Gammaproteobacteria bacterium]